MSNLPPGVGYTDLPGNRPIDEIWDRVLEWIGEDTAIDPVVLQNLVVGWCKRASKEPRKPPPYPNSKSLKDLLS